MKRLKTIMTIVLMALLGQTVNAQWWTTGNSPAPGAVFGTNNGEPLRFRTNSTQRMHINQSGTFTNGTVPTDGYIGIGADPTDIRSRLTITGTNNTGFGGDGFRAWMKTGVLNLENSDNMYVGMKEEGFNHSDAVISFGDDNSNNEKNNFRILFANHGLGVNGPHVELARYTSTGNIGFGPQFTNTDQPSSLLHLCKDQNYATFLQIGTRLGTGMQQGDGLRLGVDGSNTAYLRQQENQPFIIQTDWDNSIGGITTGERMRVTSIGAPGVRNPAGATDDNITRVAISHNGADPITDPVSLLHLGYDVGQIFPNDDGWRDWMDVGMFINQSNDNMYVGLKREEGASPIDDRFDAVISWGDNQDPVSPFQIGPDNLRFIFTSTDGIGSGDPVSVSNDGLEVARMQPSLASTLPQSNFGMMGIGNFSPNSANILNGIPVDAKLDIDGDLRIREVTRVDPLNCVLVIDTNDLNRVHWRPMDSSVGNYCSEPQDPLTGNYEIPLDSFNFYFSGQLQYPGNGFNTTNVGIGEFCGSDLRGKLHVWQRAENFLLDPNTPISIAGYFVNTSQESTFTYGLFGEAEGFTANVGGEFQARFAQKENVGVEGIANSPVNNPTVNYGGRFIADSAVQSNLGIWAEAPINTGSNYAAWFEGDINVTGMTYNISDLQLKQNIETFTNANELLDQLNPVKYNFRTEEYSFMNLPQVDQIGLIAQEVENVLPDLVKQTTRPAQLDASGAEVAAGMELRTVNYIQLIPLLIAGNKEMQSDLREKDEMIHELYSRLERLEQCIDESRLCSETSFRMSTESETGESIVLKNHDAIILDQNLPNPFSEQTTIKYFLPESVQNAEIIFYDIRGRVIDRVWLESRGESSLTVFGKDLNTGIYTYSLISDSEVISTRKMLKN